MTKLRNAELRLIQDTGSPTGRYAIAWGIPGISRLNQFTQHNLPEDRVRNFIVEKRTLNVVGTIPLHTRSIENVEKRGQYYNYKNGGDDWHGWGDIGRSHSHVSTYWDRSEQWTVILHSGKWSYNAIYLCHQCDRQSTDFKIIEIGDQVEDFIKNYLLQTRRNAYLRAHHRDERDPFIDIPSLFEGKAVQNCVRISPPHIELDIITGIPKKEYGDPLALNATLELRIHRYLRGFSVSPVNLEIDRGGTTKRTIVESWSSIRPLENIPSVFGRGTR